MLYVEQKNIQNISISLIFSHEVFLNYDNNYAFVFRYTKTEEMFIDIKHKIKKKY